MAVTNSALANNAATDAVVDLIDIGTTNSAGKIIVKDGTTTLVELSFSNPAFGDSVSGIATADTILDGTAVASGVADSFDVVDCDEAVICSGAVSGTSGSGELKLNNTSIEPTQVVTVSSMTYDAFVS